jgi:transposase
MFYNVKHNLGQMAHNSRIDAPFSFVPKSPGTLAHSALHDFFYLKCKPAIFSKRTKPGFEVIPKRWLVERTFAWLKGFRSSSGGVLSRIS